MYLFTYISYNYLWIKEINIFISNFQIIFFENERAKYAINLRLILDMVIQRLWQMVNCLNSLVLFPK